MTVFMEQTLAKPEGILNIVGSSVDNKPSHFQTIAFGHPLPLDSHNLIFLALPLVMHRVYTNAVFPLSLSLLIIV